jgi:arsenite methyltransferase
VLLKKGYIMKEIKDRIKDFYGKIAKGAENNCCGGSCCCGNTADYKIYTGDYLKGLNSETINASMGCANPLALANLKKGEIVLDLGSGGGIDAFISSRYVGPEGKVYGLDMTDEMLSLANKNMKKMNIDNVEFLKGYIEDIPLEDESVDVVISNCVINLSENKEKVMNEAFRVLKPNGRLAIADVVLLKEIPEDVIKDMDMWSECITGALSVVEYRRILEKEGFTDILIDPVSIYTREMLQGMVKGRTKGLDDVTDNAFASAHIKAYKRT